MTVTNSDDLLSNPQTTQGYVSRTLQAARDAILLKKQVYPPWLEETQENPFRSGAKFLALILLTVAIANCLGMLLDYLTLPRATMIQDEIFQGITRAAFYQSLVTNQPLFGALFPFFYRVTWMIIRLNGGYPTPASAIGQLISTPLSGIFQWWTVGFLAQFVAARLGGKARPKIFYSAMALAYSPWLLAVANLIPGLTVPAGLLQTWVLATTYQAVRTTYGLSWKRSVLIVLLPYLLMTILLLLALVFGVLLGVVVYQAMY